MVWLTMEDGGDDSSQDELHNIKCLKFMGELRQCVCKRIYACFNGIVVVTVCLL